MILTTMKIINKEAVSINVVLKELAILSKTLGTINLEVPIEDDLSNFKVEEWDREKVLEIFKELNFNRYIDRFNLKGENGEKGNSQEKNKELYKKQEKTIEEIKEFVIKEKEMIFYLLTYKIEEEKKPKKK